MTKPKFLLCVISVMKLEPWHSEDDVPERTYEQWIPYNTREEAEKDIATSERPGFGKTYTSITYHLFTVDLLPSGDPVAVPPISMFDVAHEFGPDRRVKVGLRGKGSDGAAVYWDTRGNSFAVVKPAESMLNDKRVVTDQGVVLVSINGIGEVRWTVFRGQEHWNENDEATNHFGLTWSDNVPS